MDKRIQRILNKIEKKGYKAYIVGGYVRDYLRNETSYDIDIATQATPEELDTFLHGNKSNQMYGSFRMKEGQYTLDITTFRKELSYENRHPEVEFISSLEEDIQRRDFTINALALTKENELIDQVGGLKDIQKGIIRSLGNPTKKMKEDPLRILRAIRFATTLDYRIHWKTIRAIKRNRKLLRTLSPKVVKRELDKILKSKNYQKGLVLLKRYRLNKYLNIDYKKVSQTEDTLGMYAQMKLPRDFDFKKEEKRRIASIQRILTYGKINHVTLYKEGLQANEIAASIIGYAKEEVKELDQTLVIRSPKDLKMNKERINQETAKEERKNLYKEIIENVLIGKIKNDPNSIQEYVTLKEGTKDGGKHKITKK